MHTVYNSDHFVVVAFDVPQQAAAGPQESPGRNRGGYEIVDKLSQKGIFLDGALAEHFQQGVRRLVEDGPDAERIDDFIAGFTALAQQPVVMH